MNDPVVQQLQFGLDAHGRALLERRAELEQLLAGVSASFPGKVQALLIMLDKQAVAFLTKWAADTRPDKARYEQVRDQIVAKFEQANVLNAGAAGWAFDAWAQALRIAPAPAPAPAPMSPAATAQPGVFAAAPGGGAAVRNVYAPPGATVDDLSEGDEDTAAFIERGRSVAAGRGVAWIGAGWQLFKANPLIWIVNVVLFLLIAGAVQVVPFIGGLAGMLLAPVLAGGLMIGAHAVRRGEALEVAHLFAGFREQTGSLILIGVIYLAGLAILLLLLVGALMGVGVSVFNMRDGVDPAIFPTLILAILVMVALAIPLAMAYWFAPALVALNRLSAVAAMKASFFGCLKNILPFLLYTLVAMLAGLVAFIPLGLGWFVLGPVLVASMYTSYRDIFYAE